MWAMVLGVVEKVGNSYLSVEPGFTFILVFLKGNKNMRERTFGRYCVLATVQKESFPVHSSCLSTEIAVATPALCFVSYCDSELDLCH